jgi:acetyl-CoA synthetase
LPGVTATKPGSAQVALPGIEVDVVDDLGQHGRPTANGGYLVVKSPWPSDAARHLGRPGALQGNLLGVRFDNMYFAGDGAKKDEDGDIWLLGRVDDVMNVSGHRFSTTRDRVRAGRATPTVAEAAVVGRLGRDDRPSRGGLRDPARATAAQDPDVSSSTLRASRRQADRPDRANPSAILVVARAAEDPLRQNHAPTAASDVAEGREAGDATTLADAGIMQLISESLKK